MKNLKHVRLFEEFNVLTKQRLIDVFVCALEGGSNNWYFIKNIPKEISEIKKSKNMAFSEAIGEYVLTGGQVEICDVEDEDEVLGYVNMDTILDAINLMKEKYPQNYTNIVNEEDDADDADIFFQLAVMGKVVFG